MSDLSILVLRVSQADEIPLTTNPTGRVAGPWVEFYEAIPGAGYGFWARLEGDSYVTVEFLDGDSYVTVEFLDGDSDPTGVELEAQAILDGSV